MSEIWWFDGDRFTAGLFVSHRCEFTKIKLITKIGFITKLFQKN